MTNSLTRTSITCALLSALLAWSGLSAAAPGESGASGPGWTEYVSWFSTGDSPPPAFVIPEFALDGTLCLDPDPCHGSWTSISTQELSVDTAIPIVADRETYVFALGDRLSGSHRLSLSPTRLFAPDYPLDPGLRVRLLNASEAVDAFAAPGTLAFAASMDTPYYVSISGSMHSGDIYSLSLSAVPEPGQWALTIGGLIALAGRRLVLAPRR